MKNIFFIFVLIVGLQSCTKEQYERNVAPCSQDVDTAPDNNLNQHRGSEFDSNTDGSSNDDTIDSDEILTPITDPNNDPDSRRKKVKN